MNDDSLLACGEQLTGWYLDYTPVCDLHRGHHGAHEGEAPTAYSARIRWTANNLFWLEGVTAS